MATLTALWEIHDPLGDCLMFIDYDDVSDRVTRCGANNQNTAKTITVRIFQGEAVDPFFTYEGAPQTNNSYTTRPNQTWLFSELTISPRWGVVSP